MEEGGGAILILYTECMPEGGGALLFVWRREEVLYCLYGGGRRCYMYYVCRREEVLLYM